MIKSNLKRIDISKFLNKKKGYSILLSKRLINSLIEILTMNINHKNLVLKNIGSFKVIQKKQRIGRNPKTKEKFIISARNSLSFITSKQLLNKLNK
ncbi:HU family DNA-binding protein [Pelagibacteraceae bacterium]|nr:HU family DNA-binding protein [Pelagibacteraceae bacterium]